ncbi:MAG TPA: sugar phosphate isomerase/epimerase family protein [Verrucomicrobiae bacterium]|nr:sugar phosphate isomerase/epimerase family protein [Verrucomicrobiae bacterium]
MQRILSTYLFVSKKLNREVLAQIHGAGFQAVEIFASRSHFDYASKPEVQAIAQALADNRLQLGSVHAPTSRDLNVNREGGSPLSVTEVERVRRIEAMDELKRVIDVAEDLPFSRLILHMGGSRENADPRKRDAAFSSLEHLVLHAKHIGVTICVENTTSEMGAPSYLRSFVDETRLTGLRFNFDIGHAHMAEGPEDERVAKSFEPLKDLIASAHVHDNHGDKDEHLPPYDGTIAWPAALALLKSTPAGAALPLTLELKEKSGHDAPSVTDQLATASQSLDRLEHEFDNA